MFPPSVTHFVRATFPHKGGREKCIHIIPRSLEWIGIAFAHARTRRHDDEKQSLLPFQEIPEVEDALALGGTQLSFAQKPAETAISLAVDG